MKSKVFLFFLLFCFSLSLLFPKSIIAQDLSSSVTDRFYTGQIKDDTGLYYYNARYYDPFLGIFTSADRAQGPNRYAYVGGNPIMRNDPSGRVGESGTGVGGNSPGEGSEYFWKMWKLNSMSWQAQHTNASDDWLALARYKAVAFGGTTLDEMYARSMVSSFQSPALLLSIAATQQLGQQLMSQTEAAGPGVSTIADYEYFYNRPGHTMAERYPEMVTLYHGTNLDRAEKITNEGLIGTVGYENMTDNPSGVPTDLARRHGLWTGARKGAVVELRVPSTYVENARAKMEAGHMLPGEQSYALSGNTPVYPGETNYKFEHPEWDADMIDTYNVRDPSTPHYIPPQYVRGYRVVNGLPTMLEYTERGLKMVEIPEEEFLIYFPGPYR